MSATPKRASPCQWCGPTAAAARLVQPAGEATLTEDISRVLPMPSELAELFTAWPGGIRRGATVAGVGSTSLLLTLLAGAMAEGEWAAVVGMPAFGALAAHEAGIVLDRLALVPAPGPDWASAVGALIDGVDVVAVATPPGAPEAVIRALMNRARQRGCALIPATVWPRCDMAIELVDRRWIGLVVGHGRLVRQEVTLRSAGRGRSARPRTVTTVLPPPSIRLPAVTAREAFDAALGLLPAEPPPARRAGARAGPARCGSR